MENKMIGKYVVVRCRDAGVHAGFLEAHEDRTCVLTEARRLWFWKALAGKGDFLNTIANHGLEHDGSKIGEAVSRIHLTENCEIIECSEASRASISAAPIYNG